MIRYYYKRYNSILAGAVCSDLSDGTEDTPPDKYLSTLIEGFRRILEKAYRFLGFSIDIYHIAITNIDRRQRKLFAKHDSFAQVPDLPAQAQ